MKTTKILLALVCGMLCFGIAACGSSGGGGGGGAQPTASAGEVIAGNWNWEAVEQGGGDTSTSTLVVAEEVIDGATVTTYTFSGVVRDGIQYGLAECRIAPADEETLANLHTAKSVSFKMIGDGKIYNIEIPINTVTDWGFHYRPIETVDGQMVEFDIPFRGILQPAWAQTVRFNQTRVTHVIIKTKNATEGGLGEFKVKVWDLQLHM
jgi:hypothetical protein